MTLESDFENWMAQVDIEVSAIAGVSVHDLPDYAFRDAFDSGEWPDQVARDLLQSEGWIFSEEEEV